jgi:hypothetical protein
LCDRCERVYTSHDDDAAVEVMRSHRSWVADENVAECIRQPLVVFRRADLGSRRLYPEPPGLGEARKEGFVPLRELTGVAYSLGRLWPSEHRRWFDDLGPSPGEDAHDERLERWLVRSPWPSLSVGQTLNALWRWVERDAPRPRPPLAEEPRIVEFFAWTEAEAEAFVALDQGI